MECKFTTNGMAIDYHGTIKPCCVFRPTDSYRQTHNIKRMSPMEFLRSPAVSQITKDLAASTWPGECGNCAEIEQQDRHDSMRFNGDSAYGHYSEDDITLEIRAGSVCNFACQTCWPQASSRVAQYYRQAGMQFEPAQDMDWKFDRLDEIKHRIRDIVMLGGEPFYDPRCVQFLSWMRDNELAANLTIFTNGSLLDVEFLESYQGKITVVFSIDAVGRPAEYIRLGCQWPVVEENYDRCRQLTNVETRINVTTSPYNYHYLPDLMSWVCKHWPPVVSFGIAATTQNSWFMDESVVLPQHRQDLVQRLQQAQDIIQNTEIEAMQKANAINAMATISQNLKDLSFDPSKHAIFCKFVQDMDRVKKINMVDYCPELLRYFNINDSRLAKDSPVFLTVER